MDIHIEDAFEIPNTNPGEVMELLKKLRREYLMVCAESLTESLGMNSAELKNFSKLNSMIERAMLTGRPAHLNFTASVAIYFTSKTTIIHVINSDQSIVALLKKIRPEASNVDYSELHEQPEGVTELEWGSRGGIWREILGDGLTPDEAGLIYSLASPNDAAMIALSLDTNSDAI